jgi:hypothetical protein
MVQPHITESREQVVDTMIGLTRLSILQRAIIAGSEGMEFYLALRKRGFVRVATPTTCRIARGQHAIGFVAGHDPSGTIEGALASISPFLSANATVAVLIDSRERGGSSLRIRSKLQQMGFQIEAGVRCQQGLMLSAYRQNFRQMEIAA